MLIVFCILDKAYFDKFLASNMYQKYKNEILLSTRSNRTSVSSFSSLEQQETFKELNPQETTTTTNPVKTCTRHKEPPEPEREPLVAPACRIPQEDSIWNLSEPSIGELNLDAINSYSLTNFKKKFEKFRKSLISFHSERKARSAEEDEYELAEKAAAQLISEVIRSNQQL